MTFVRQVVSLVTNPHLLENHSDIFPSDAVARARVREGGREGVHKGEEKVLFLLQFLSFNANEYGSL